LEDWLSTSGDARLARLGQISAAEYYARAAARHGADQETFKALLEEAYGSDFNSQLADYVRELAAQGVPVWALTNSLSTEAQWMARRGFEGLFRGVISSCECGLAKPDLAIFALAAHRAGVEPREIVFADDVMSHVEAARSAGFDAFQFVDTGESIAQFSLRVGAQSQFRG
jgi:HAD superfamily hydrolase (TIGR01509 family)